MSINKDIYNQIHDEFIVEDKIPDKDIYVEMDDEYIGANKIFNKDIFNEIHDEYIAEDKIVNKFLKDDHKKAESYSNPKESNMYINCKLKVDFDTKNKMIYLYPGKAQYFTVDVSKCCGDVTIKYKGYYPSKGIFGNLGIYKIVQSGIFVKTYSKLDPKKNDFLNFTAIDECTKECYDFVVVFSCK